MKYYPVVDKYYWTIKASAILVGGEDIGICAGGCKLVVDTGTSLMTGPWDEVKQIMQKIEIDENCNYENLPDITYVIGQEHYSLTP